MHGLMSPNNFRNYVKRQLKLLVQTEGELLAAIHRLHLEKLHLNEMYRGTNLPRPNFQFGPKMNGLKKALKSVRSEIRNLRSTGIK
jgi:hypothetical protein